MAQRGESLLDEPGARNGSLPSAAHPADDVAPQLLEQAFYWMRLTRAFDERADLEFAENSPFPDPATLTDGLYAP